MKLPNASADSYWDPEPIVYLFRGVQGATLVSKLTQRGSHMTAFCTDGQSHWNLNTGTLVSGSSLDVWFYGRHLDSLEIPLQCVLCAKFAPGFMIFPYY